MQLLELNMNEQQIEKFLTIQQAQLAMMMGIYHNLQVLCAQNGKEAAVFNWRDVHSLLETGKHELEET
jgi:SAM-dependent MidA family methyltransferase